MDIVDCDATIDLNTDLQPSSIDLIAELADLGAQFRDKTLAAESRVYGHQKDKITLIEHVKDGVDWRVWVEADPRQDFSASVMAERFDLLQVAVEVRARLGMYRDDVGARSSEVVHVFFWFDDHQVTVDGLFRHRSKGGHDQGADGKVRNKTTIHDVDVDPVGASSIDVSDLITQASEVCAKD